jgi:hypothetical protein
MRALGFDLKKEDAKRLCSDVDGKSVISYEEFLAYASNRIA